MGDRSDFIDITWDIRKAELKNKIRNGWNKVGQFVSSNKTEVAAVAVPLVGKLIFDAVQSVKRAGRQKNEQRLKENYIWDPSLGMWFETKKKLTSSQRLEFSRRRDQGEKVGNILRSMKVLK